MPPARNSLAASRFLAWPRDNSVGWIITPAAKAPRAFKRKVENAGLKCVSGHFELKDLKDPATIAAAQELGLTYMILVFPSLPSLQGPSVQTTDFKDLVPLYEKISLSDYRWNAEQSQ